MVTNITEHLTVEGRIHDDAIRDLVSNRIVGYTVDDRITAQLAVAALLALIARRQPAGHRLG